MPNVNVKGRYRIYTHDGVEPLLFTSYSNSLCSIRRPNPNTFITISTYIPNSLSPFTTFAPGSSYTIVTKSNTADFSMGPYTRADRLPSSVTFKSPNFYHGLDKNSITVALSSYALSVNAPLSTAFTYIPNQDGYFINSISFNTERLIQGLPSLLTHLTPNSSYQFINRTPFTFFAPLQSEMGDWWAFGDNSYGALGMGHQYGYRPPGYRESTYTPTISTERIFGNWVKIVENAGSVFALSACGNKKKLFVCGKNEYGQLGLGYTSPLSAPITVFKNVPGNYEDICPGNHSLVVDDSFQLYTCGRNDYGQLGLGDSGLGTNRSTFTYADLGFEPVAVETDPPSISNGILHSLVRDVNGNLWSCGDNTYGQLGLGDTNPRDSFTLVGNIGYQDMAAGPHCSAYLSNNRMYACGYNYFSYLSRNLFYRIGVSNNEASTSITTFTQEVSGFNDIQNLWVGDQGIFVKRSSSNVLWACGVNYWANLGMTVGNFRFSGSTHYIQMDRRALQPTIIPSDILKFFPSVRTVLNISARNYPYWVDLESRLKTIVESDGSNPTLSFTPYEINTGLSVSNINDNKSFNSVLFHNRTLVTPTPTKTSTPTPTPTPTATPINLVPSIATNAIINPLQSANSSSTGDRLFWYYSSDLFTTTNRTWWASLQGSRTAANINIFSNTCFNFKDNDNVVIATMVKNAQGNYNLLKQTIRNRSTWSVPDSLNDIGTNSTTIATWNNPSYNQPFFTRGANQYGTVDMFVHSNSNTAVYVFTQIGTASNTYSDPFSWGEAGAWTFTVNLANNSVSNANKLSYENLCSNQAQNNNSDAYASSAVSRTSFKTTRLLTKLPDGRIIFKSLYLTGAFGSNYGAVAKIGYYNQGSWDGFTQSIAYEIPNSSASSSLPNNLAPIFCEFTALGNDYYLAWCTKTNAQARENATVRSPASLVLRNLQTNAQVNVDSLLNTNSYVNSFGTFGNMLMQPYDIIAIPSSRQIYVVYTKFINFTGDYASIDNTYGTFLKRYDSNLNLIDTSTLFTFNPRSYAGAQFYPSLCSPKFSYKVSNTGVLTLILSFGYAVGGNPATNGDIIMTNTPSTNNTWTTILNRTGATNNTIWYPHEGRTIISI